MSGATSPSTLLRLERVTKKWGQQVVLDDVNFEIPAGAVVGVAGGNGAGKTTLLRICSGMVIPEAGITRFRGDDIENHRTAYHKAIGLLSAGDRGLYARLTVRQNLDIWGGLAGLVKRDRQRRIADTLSDFELDELESHRVDRLSMGQRQRVRLAMTFLHEPMLVFLDEPRTSLDESGVSLLARSLKLLVDDGGAAVWVSPEPDEPLVTQSWVLENGHLRAYAPARRVPTPLEAVDLTALREPLAARASRP